MKALNALAICTMLAAPSIASAQFTKPEFAIKYRQSTMFIQGQHFGRIGAVVKGTRPYNQDEVVQNAMIVEEMSKLHWPAFGPGTDQGAPTRALPAIWKEPDKFQAAGKRLQEEVQKLVATAKGGDQGQLKAAFGAVGQACDGCHEDYRKD
jgi:cytochrome c556